MPWILLGLAVVGIAVFAAVAMRRRSQAAAARTAALRRAESAARELADAAAGIPIGNEPTAMAVWWQLLDGNQATLDAALSTLGTVPADDPLAPRLADVAAARAALRDAVATDRRLRIGPPAPTSDQLAYSVATIRERAGALRDSAEALDSPLQETPMS